MVTAVCDACHLGCTFAKNRGEGFLYRTYGIHVNVNAFSSDLLMKLPFWQPHQQIKWKCIHIISHHVLERSWNFLLHYQHIQKFRTSLWVFLLYCRAVKVKTGQSPWCKPTRTWKVLPFSAVGPLIINPSWCPFLHYEKMENWAFLSTRQKREILWCVANIYHFLLSIFWR